MAQAKSGIQREGKGAKKAESLTNFMQAYNSLNSAQKKAVDAIEGPVMVIAGPGTGKTQILALRIANILKSSDTAPSSILALTFTESGVASMRRRLVSLIGAAGYQVRIHTFHGFCNGVIQSHQDHFPDIVGREQFIELDQIRMLEAILDAGSFKKLRPLYDPYLHVRTIRGAISDVKRENVSPLLLSTLLKEQKEMLDTAPDLYHEKGAHKGKMKGVYKEAYEKLEKSEEFLQLYKAYEEGCRRARVYDFEDTILSVVRTLETDEDLKLILQEQSQYILADEHQDANGAQNRLLELLSDFHEAPNLFVVGDEKQAIYRFQGASLENFLYFKKRYPAALIVELTSNYRSTQVILDAAHDVIDPSVGHKDVPRPRLGAEAGHAHLPVALVEAPREDAELGYVTTAIEHLRKEGAALHEIAILVRRNSDVRMFERACAKAGIPAVGYGEQDIFLEPVVQSIIALLRAAAYVGDSALLYPVLFAPFLSLPPLDIYKVTAHREQGESLYEVLSSSRRLGDIGVQDVAVVAKIVPMITRIAQRSTEVRLLDCIDYAVAESGLMPYLAGSDRMHEVLSLVRTFLSYAEAVAVAHPSYSLADFLGALDAGKQYGLATVKSGGEQQDFVRIMTVHRAKGMEFDHVFVPFAHERRWGKTRSFGLSLPLYGAVVKPDEETVLDDERRLFYVAMTRARKSLTLSYARYGVDGREQLPSPFINDIRLEHILRIVAGESTLPVVPAVREAFSLERERAFARERLNETGLSVSALNNFLESPWKYFFQNLLRIPSRKESHQEYGTAMDAALKWLTRKEKEGTSVTKAEFVSVFEHALSRAYLASSELVGFTEKGTAALGGYFDLRHTEGTLPVDAGITFAVPFVTGLAECPEIVLRGEYDKIEFVDGGVHVIDFKTGLPKSRNYIEGTTKDSNGNYKRQLVFYALLASLDPVRNWNVEEGSIDFLEPSASGKYVRETFPITHMDVEKLKLQIVEAVRDICELSFFDSACDSDAWSEEGCTLVAALKRKLK